MTIAEVRERIVDGSAEIGVVGLGYVGLPVACLLAATGLRVVGIDLKADRIGTINAGRCPIEGEEPGLAELLADVVASGRLTATTETARLRSVDVILIAVDTPVDPEDHRPRYEALRGACASIGRELKRGALVIVESTISPGTMQRVVVPELEAASGLRGGEDFYVGHCPERVMPGRLLRNLRQMSRVVGGQTPGAAEAMVALYSRYVEADLDIADPLTAELVKTAENAYRDVNIAFANQLALICEAVGGDVWRVRELVNKSPGRNVLLPGAGVGGHCIPKDPWLLAAALVEGAAPMIEAARAVNDAMPAHVADLAAQLLAEEGVKVAGARIAVLGYAYLEDSEDTRDSPTTRLLPHLRALGSEIALHDPCVKVFAGDVMEAVSSADCCIVMVRHSSYRTIDLTSLAARMRHPLLVDARRVFEPSDLQAAGLRYRTLGNGRADRTSIGVIDGR